MHLRGGVVWLFLLNKVECSFQVFYPVLQFVEFAGEFGLEVGEKLIVPLVYLIDDQVQLPLQFLPHISDGPA